MENKQIYDFAVKWESVFRDFTNYKFQDIYFKLINDCEKLGFKEDLGIGFEYSYEEAFCDYLDFEDIVDYISDVDILGSIIYHKLKTFDKNSDAYEFSLWLNIAFTRFVEIFCVKIIDKKLKNVNISSKKHLKKLGVSKIVEEVVTLNILGEVKVYIYENFDGISRKIEEKSFNIDSEMVEKIFENLICSINKRKFPKDDIDENFWTLSLEDISYEKYKFKDFLGNDLFFDSLSLSEFIRNTLDIDDLLLFDNNKYDEIKKFEIKYDRITKISDDEINYSENFIIDADLGTIEHIQNISEDIVVSKKYQIKYEIKKLLDEINSKNLFENNKQNLNEIIFPSNEERKYSIIIDFKKKGQKVINGFYYKNNLPKCWRNLIYNIEHLIKFFDYKELFDEKVFDKELFSKDDFMFCSVVFSDCGKKYYYISEDNNINIGDDVLVSVGKEHKIKIVKVVKIEYFNEKNSPFPIEKTKRIIRKCVKSDYYLYEDYE